MHFQEKNEIQELLDSAKRHLKDKLPFVLYRLPDQKQINGIFQDDASVLNNKPVGGSGFVFAPFSIKKNSPIWLRPDVCFKAEQTKTQFVGNTRGQLLEDGNAHKALVDKAVKQIHKGTIKKVVLSQPFKLGAIIEPTLLFRRAIQKYPHAFCYLWSHPETGIWIGASPEQLAAIKDDFLFTTALAGTLPQKNGKLPKWTIKEYEEQQLVTEYLKEQLHPFLKEINVGKRKSVLAGTLWHLKTNISGRLRDSVNIKELLDAIHPTSAVCGLPKQEALKFIAENEGYSRAYYTGYLGEVSDHHKETSVFVNLRCLQFLEDGVCIYVGGGITKDSDPQKEWEELLNKASTMQALL